MSSCILGLEIEAVYNADTMGHIPKGYYHHGYKIKGLRGWTCESDGSLRERKNKRIKNPECAEFVSVICKGTRGALNRLNNFKNYFSKNGVLELRDVLQFNNSCGAHIHIDFTGVKHNKIARYMLFEFAERNRALCFNLIKNARTLTEAQKRGIIAHYNRGYAEVVQDRFNNCFSTSSNRRREWNFTSAYEGKGLEWRSPTLYGVRTWAQFFELYKIYFRCLTTLLNMMREKQIIDIDASFNEGEIWELTRGFEIETNERDSTETITLKKYPHNIPQEDIIRIGSDRRLSLALLNHRLRASMMDNDEEEEEVEDSDNEEEENENY